ncbi:MAG: oligosaccharide flippase family protein [Chloroflexi bacterium]|nr:oligosaccharide flippase family protein [Chloroflexota bacterium]
MYNLGLIFGALVLTRIIPTDSGPFAYASQSGANVYGLAFGAILGALMHLAVQVPGLVRVRAKIRPLLRFDVEGSGHVLRLMLPRVLGLAVTQINFLVNVFFATRMAEGSNSAMNVAWFMMFFALGVIAQSAGTAVFPTLSKLADERDFDGYSGRLADALRGVAFLAIPASVGLIVLGGPVIALLFERGGVDVSSDTGDGVGACVLCARYDRARVSGASVARVLCLRRYANAGGRRCGVACCEHRAQHRVHPIRRRSVQY